MATAGVRPDDEEVASPSPPAGGTGFIAVTCHSGETEPRRCFIRRCVYAGMSSDEQDASAVESATWVSLRITRLRSALSIAPMFCRQLRPDKDGATYLDEPDAGDGHAYPGQVEAVGEVAVGDELGLEHVEQPECHIDAVRERVIQR